MSGLLTDITRAIPGTALQLQMLIDDNPEARTTGCDICNQLFTGHRLVTFVNDVPQSTICLTCAFDVVDLIRGCPDEQIRLASSITRKQSNKTLDATDRMRIAARPAKN